MITKFKIFEKKLLDTGFPKNLKRRENLKEYKYKKDDIVFHKEVGKPFFVNSINYLSDNQDYWLYNPLLNDHGWVMEEELRDASDSEKEDLLSYLNVKKFNL
jgi:hypothetical protein